MEKLKWQTRNEMSMPTNPLQKLREVFALTSRDCSEDKMIAFLYGIICEWSDESYKELKRFHGWSDKDVELQKSWHIEYNKAWNLYMDFISTEAKKIKLSEDLFLEIIDQLERAQEDYYVQDTQDIINQLIKIKRKWIKKN